jgi:hypothetical protein
MRRLTSLLPRLSALALLTALLLGAGGCSLVTIDTHVTPLPKAEMQARLLTREFASGMVAEVVRTADSIAVATSEVELKRAAIRWKLATSEAARRAALRTDPTLSLVDTWALALQMDQFFRTGAGQTLFGESQSTVTETTGKLLGEIATIGLAVQPRGDPRGVARFVTRYATEHPLVDLEFKREPIFPHWSAFRSNDDTVVTSTVGTPAEVMADAAERLTLYGNQLSDELRWRLDLLATDPRFSPEEIQALTAQLAAELKRIAAVAEQSPELARESMQSLRETFVPAVYQLDERWQATLDTFTAERKAIASELTTQREAVAAEVTTQREALAATLKEERAAVLAETGRMANEVTDRAFARLRVVLRELMVGAAVLALILLGVPFGFGFLAGRGFRRSREPTEHT